MGAAEDIRLLISPANTEYSYEYDIKDAGGLAVALEDAAIKYKQSVRKDTIKINGYILEHHLKRLTQLEQDYPQAESTVLARRARNELKREALSLLKISKISSCLNLSVQITSDTYQVSYCAVVTSIELPYKKLPSYQLKALFNDISDKYAEYKSNSVFDECFADMIESQKAPIRGICTSAD